MLVCFTSVLVKVVTHIYTFLLLRLCFSNISHFTYAGYHLFFSLLCPQTSSSQLSRLHSFNNWPLVFRFCRPLASSCAGIFKVSSMCLYSWDLYTSKGVENMSLVLLKCYWLSAKIQFAVLGDMLNGCSASIDQRSCTDLIRALLTPTNILLLSLKFG